MKSMLRKISMIIWLAALTSSASFSIAKADAIINPSTGLTANVIWSSPIGTNLGLVPVSNIGGDATSFASITVAAASFITFSIEDGFVPGDAFALALDGVLLAPTSGKFGPETRGPDATDYYAAIYTNIALSTGSHQFQLFVTDSCCFGGGTTASWSAASEAAAVPGPIVGAGLPGLVMAFGGLIAWRRCRNQGAAA